MFGNIGWIWIPYIIFIKSEIKTLSLKIINVIFSF